MKVWVLLFEWLNCGDTDVVVEVYSTYDKAKAEMDKAIEEETSNFFSLGILGNYETVHYDNYWSMYNITNFAEELVSTSITLEEMEVK